MGQCYVTFPGVVAARSVIAPRTLGITPNSIVLECACQPLILPAIGTLVIGHGIESVVLPDVKVDSATARMSTSGHMMVVKLLDRRWRWPFLHISGNYNVRMPDGTIDPTTVKSAQDLAFLLFQAMGETLFNTSMMPSNWFPEVSWDYRCAAEALHELCEISGCDVSLNLDNSVSIVKLGVGSLLPINTDLQTPSISVDPPEGPDVVTVLCGETYYESRLKLRPIAEDKDGVFKALEDLSYYQGILNSANIDDFLDINETNLPGFTDEQIEQCRNLAKKTVYKYYIVESQSDGTQDVPGYGTVSDIKQILPLNTTLLSTQESPINSSATHSKASRIFGGFMMEKSTDEYINTDSNSKETECPISHTLDRHTGIVKFSKKVVVISGGNFYPAELDLLCSYGIKDDSANGQVRYEVSRNISGASSGVLLREISRQENIHVNFIASYDQSGSVTVSNNIADVDSEVQSILDAMQSKWTSGVYGYGMYRGIKPFNTDGVIRQVVWYDDCRHGARTSVSANCETAAGPIRQNERRRRRILNHYGDHSPGDRNRWNIMMWNGTHRREGY